MRLVSWMRPVRERNRVTYTSRYGRFRIERREWVLPFASVSYRLFDGGKQVAELDTLREIKDAAEDLAGEPDQRLEK